MTGLPVERLNVEGSCMLASGSPCAQVMKIYADAPTDGSGHATITIPKAAGCCSDLKVASYNSQGLGDVLRMLSYRGYDYTADLRGDLADLGFLSDTFNKDGCQAGYNACFDFNCDNMVGLVDLGFFADHFGHTCL
jgi:hypothetical protein